MPPENTPLTDDQRVEATRKWLQKWNKGDAPADKVRAVADAVAEGADKVKAALAGLGVMLKPGKVKEFESRVLPALADALGVRQNAQRSAMAATLAAAPAARERVDGPGFPRGETIIDPGAASAAEAEALIDALDLDNVYNTCVQMTGVEPERRSIAIRVFRQDPDEAQAFLVHPLDFAVSFHPELRRARMNVIRSEPTRALAVNINFVHKYPKEVRGLLYHEFGHHWTQKAHTAQRGNLAFMEGIAELFRTAAARREGAEWHQVRSIGFQMLNGQPCPPVAAASYVEGGSQLDNIARYVTAHRLAAHLGGLDDRVMAGIAKACTFEGADRTNVTILQLLHDIERETGVTGFAQRCCADPIITPGQLRAGEMAMAFPSDALNGYAVMRINVLNNGAHFNWSRQEYNVIPQNLTEADFIREPIATQRLPFTIYVQRPTGEIVFDMTVQGALNVTPALIVKIARERQLQWPAGDTRLYYSVPNGPRVLLDQPIRIKPEDLV